MPILATLDPRALFDASPNPYVLLDPQLHIVAANRAYLRITGREANGLLGSALFEAFPSAPDSPHGRQLRQSFARVLDQRRTDQVASILYPITGADGQLENRYWSATHTPLLHADGSVRFILQHTEDVTELVQLRAQRARPALPLSTTVARVGQRASAVAAANLALGAERDVLRQMFEQTPGLLAVMRGPDHVLEIVNTALRQTLGERPLLGLPVRQALPELEGQGFFDWLDQVYRSGEPFSGRDVQALLRRSPDGPLEMRRTDFLYQPLRDASGQVQGVMMQGQDITEQVQAQHQAAASAARFQTLAHSMPNQVWTAQADGLLDWCNAQTQQYSGLSQQALLGSGWTGIVHPDDLHAAASAWQAAVSTGQQYHVGFRLRRHDGEYRWHIARALALRDDGGRISQWVGTNTDIDDQKRGAELLANLNDELTRRVAQRSAELQHTQEALRQSQKLESIGLLAGGIAHDFNNLLQVISGNLQLAQRRLDDPAGTGQLIERALDGVQRGARLAAQLLAFSRRQPLAPQVIHIGRLLQGMKDLLRQSLGQGIVLDTVVASDLWHTLADPVQVESALLNLALNARDAMAGQGRLTLEAGNVVLDAVYCRDHQDLQPGPYVVLAVSDTGCGMAPEVLQRAFEPFFTTKPVGQSSGLGLSMVYGFVKQSLGHIRVYSEPGLGSTVRLYLPRSLAAEDRPAAADAGPPLPGHETVLVAEDDDSVRATTVALLKDLGYQVLVARDAQAALAIIDSGVHIDLLFSDVVMPGPLQGSELARQAQLRRPGLVVVFTSGYTEQAMLHSGGPLAPGLQLLSKPFTRDALARKLRQALQPAAPASSPAATAAAATTPLRVLLCEDDAVVRETLDALLQDMGCQVWAAGSLAHARALLPRCQPQLLITDLGLPDGDGAQLARWAQASQPGLQVAIASGQGAAPALAGVQLLRKPFDADALAALLQQVRAGLPAA